jgi:hypothetical protein
MTPLRWRLTTDEERERFASASYQGGRCAVCGRTLGTDEPVYIVRVLIHRKPLPAAGTGWSTRPVLRDAPLGRECVAPPLLVRLEKQEIDPCISCGRPVYHEGDRAGRQQATCSRRCEKARRG